jgi:catechol 2,3-dioxygenase-like lactoylglutathione lyase family enzyme
MYPEDRVLVGVMPDPRDLEIAREQHWYRIPARHAPSGIHAEYVAFYFTRKFGPDLRWAIHFYARRTGHELVRRIDLLPDEINHPRAREVYYKLQLGPLKQKDPPIISLRWRRITFIQTTWDRFVAATEINDLFRSDDTFVDRVYYALKSRGIQPEREVEVWQGKARYVADLAIPCRKGMLLLGAGEEPPAGVLALTGEEEQAMQAIQTAIEQRGGLLTSDLPPSDFSL